MNKVTQAEYWILTRAVEFGWSVSMLRQEEIGHHQSEYHGLDDEALIQLLTKMFSDGQIIATDDDGNQESPEFVPDIQRVADLISTGNTQVSYWLTAKGGKIWEDLTKPNWQKFVSVENYENPIDIYGGSHETIAEYVSFCVEGWNVDPFCRPDTTQKVDVSVLSRDTVAPWNATYWKTIEIGYRQRVQLSYGDAPLWCTAEYSMGWYTVPEEMLPFPESPTADWDL